MSAALFMHGIESLIRACWQGGAAIGLVWGLVRLFPKLPVRLQCWLWRLAYLKLLIALLWLPPVRLALLPASPSSVTPASTASWDDTLLASPVDLKAGAFSMHNASPDMKWASTVPWLLAIWLVGIGLCGVGMAREWQAARRLKRRCTPESDEPLLAAYAQLCRQFGLRRSPQLLACEGSGSPVLLGGIRPVIVLPAALRDHCTPEEFRLMLAHELAHLKRRDLLWGWLPAISHSLFSFHPLVWLANREWRIAQELACDELALQVTNAPVGDYGTTLLKVAVQSRPNLQLGLAAVSADELPQTLRRRLIAMQTIRTLQPFSHRRLLTSCAILAMLAAIGLVPWQVVAQTPPSTPIDKSGSPVAGSGENRTQQMIRELGLTQSQQDQIKAIVAEVMEKARDIKTSQTISDSDKGAAMKTLFQATEQRIKAVLTPDQWNKVQQMGVMKAFFEKITPGQRITIDAVDADISQTLASLAQVGLTPIQQGRLKQIFTTGRGQAAALINNPSLSEEDRMVSLKRLREAVQQQIMAVLTPEQRQKFTATMQKNAVDKAPAPFVDLTDAQRSQMEEIIGDSKRQAEAIQNDPSLSEADKKAEMIALQETTRQRIEAILTADQLRRLHKMGKDFPFKLIGKAPNGAIDEEIAKEVRRLEGVGLTDDQKIHLKKMIAEASSQADAILQNPATSKEDKRSQLQSLHQTIEQQIQVLLTPDQRRKLDSTPLCTRLAFLHNAATVAALPLLSAETWAFQAAAPPMRALPSGDADLKPQEPISSLLAAMDRLPLVALTERHMLQEWHDFITELLFHPHLPGKITDIVVEFGPFRQR